jgi:DNA-binding MarR family transcriptional regulator
MSIKKIITAIDKSIQPEVKMMSIAIIEGENNIIYSTENWDISKDINNLNTVWNKLKSGRFIISGVEHIVIQVTQERLVAVTPEQKWTLLGFKDDKRKFLCRLDPKGPNDQMIFGLNDAAKTLIELRTEEPYMDLDADLGKVEEKEEEEWVKRKLLPNDTLNLQRLGLLKSGLSKDEAEVYLALLKKGDVGDTIGNLNRELLNLKRTHIYRIIDRLEKKTWVKKVIGSGQRTTVYRAIALNYLLDDLITQRETELTILKSFRYIMGEKLENGWIKVTDLERDLRDMYNKKYDFNSLGITGIERDCGLLIFDYGKEDIDDAVILAALELASVKLMANLLIQEEIKIEETEKYEGIKEGYKNPDIEDIKNVDKSILNYLGAEIHVKFKEGSETAHNVGVDWVVAAKQVAIPIEDKIYIVWGSEEKFPILLNMILKIR